MRFIRFTSYENGKPLLVREDLVGGWQFFRGHGLLLMLGQDMVDIEIKEDAEGFLRAMEGPCRTRKNPKEQIKCPTDS